MSDIKISILLPSRGRTELLDSSIDSLLTTANDPTCLQFLLGFDNDDQDSSKYFIDVIAPKLNQAGATYSILEFMPMGYNNLHQYLNKLARHARADWWVFWNDDAEMLDKNWDQVILEAGDRFCIQAFNTHNMHPYSIFPIVPRAWYEQLGHLSSHPLNDAYISQIAWLLDIMLQIPIKVAHNRYDLTGKNLDSTFTNRKMSELEGNIRNPKDFNHVNNRQQRIDDAVKLGQYLEARGHDLTHFKEALSGKRSAWEKMLAADPNNQIAEYSPVTGKKRGT